MEFSQQNMENESEREILSSQEEMNSFSESKSRRMNKKIQKRHRKKKGKISKHRSATPSHIQSLLSKICKYFSCSKQEIVKNFKTNFKSSVHVRKIIDKDVQSCYTDKKEGLQKELKDYLDFVTIIDQEPSVERIGLKSEKWGTKMCLHLLRDLKNTPDRHHRSPFYRLLNPNEITLLSRRQQLMSQIVTFANAFCEERGYPPVNIDQVLLQLLTLCKMNSIFEEQILRDLQGLLGKQDHLYNCHQEVDFSKEEEIKNQYASAVIIKNLQHAFEEKKIDFFNYHKQNEYYEQNGFLDIDFEKLVSFYAFKKYILSKKPKNHKNSNYLLKTPCSACFSDISQLSNPILNCPQCHMRVHRFCQNLQNRCHRCRYGRTSNQQKKQSSYCYICNREREKGLMIQTVTNKSPHQFAHNFCLLLHNRWKTQNEVFVGEYEKPKQENKKCLFCSKGQGMLFDCSCCNSSFHGMCAFLQGCSFSMKKGRKFDYNIEIRCCLQQKLKERLSYQRKFKLNFQKMIFREDKDLFGYMMQEEQKERPDQ